MLTSLGWWQRATFSLTTAAATPAAEPGQWTCSSDAECEQTCAFGAVNREWLTRHPDECDDGCGEAHGRQACRDGECVTMAQDGSIDASCTKRSSPKL